MIDWLANWSGWAVALIVVAVAIAMGSRGKPRWLTSNPMRTWIILVVGSIIIFAINQSWSSALLVPVTTFGLYRTHHLENRNQ